MSLVRRRLQAVITLGTGNFGDGAGNTITLPADDDPDGALRMSAQIVKAASPGFDTCDLRIFGMRQTDMNKISRLGAPLTTTRNNGLKLLAGDADAGMAVVFAGTIQNAAQNFQDAPNVCLNIGAQGGGLAAMAPVTPLSVKGSTDVATLMTTIAASMTPPLSLENHGVSAVLVNPYLPGTAIDQMNAVAQAANIYAKIEEETLTLAIWPKDGARDGSIPLISADSGMVGYPTFAALGVGVRSIYFPGLHVGGFFTVKSAAVPGASKKWRLNQLSYELESEMPGGAWFMDLVGADISGFVGVPQ